MHFTVSKDVYTVYSMANANNLLRFLDLKIPDFKYQRYSSNYNEVNRCLTIWLKVF